MAIPTKAPQNFSRFETRLLLAWPNECSFCNLAFSAACF